MKDLREDLKELTEASEVLLDDQLYTFDSYRTLVQAVAYAKVVLADEASDEETLQEAYTELCEAVDEMEPKAQPEPELIKTKAEKKSEGLQKALPYLLGGAALGGLLLGKKLFGKKKKKDEPKGEKKK